MDIIFDSKGRANAVIPANHKLMLLCQRLAATPEQRIERGKYVMFKFFVDGDALSEGELHEASIKSPEVHWAKCHIETRAVKDEQTVEDAGEANPFIGTFVVKVFTKLKESTVTEEFRAVPEDDRVHEKTKRRICCAADAVESEKGDTKQYQRYQDGVPGLKQVGSAQGVISVSYDNIVGTRARHIYEKAFQIDNMRKAGVTEEMMKEAFPCGIPNTASTAGEVITLDECLENEPNSIKKDIKEEVVGTDETDEPVTKKYRKD